MIKAAGCPDIPRRKHESCYPYRKPGHPRRAGIQRCPRQAGNLANLTTTDKSNLVAAINEPKAAVVSLGGDRRCADRGHRPHYSSTKIVSLLDALKAEILGGLDAAYDTLVEIQQLLQNGTSGLDALLAAVNNRGALRCGTVADRAEQLQARSNIGAVAASDVGNTDTDFVAVFVGALV